MYNNSNEGVGVPTVVLIVLLILKLTDVIDWSWWWVTSPLWIGFVILLLVGMVLLVWSVIDRYKNRKRW